MKYTRFMSFYVSARMKNVDISREISTFFYYFSEFHNTDL